MAILRYGRYVTSSEADIGQVGAGGQRACVYDALSSTIIGYQLGFWGGKDSGTPKARAFVAAVTGTTPDPGALIASTNELTPSATMLTPGDGAAYVGDITPTIFTGGTRYAMGLTARSGVLGHSMRQAVAISALNRNFYDKSGLASTVPTDPVGGSASYNGHLTVWLVGMVNEAPATPTGLTPSGALAGGVTTPTMEANFSDPNETLPNGAAFDYLNQVQVQVRRKSDQVSFWDTMYTASSGERSAKKSSIVYAGTSLAYGTDYEWRVKQSDRAGAWSGWTAWTTFTPAAAGSVGTPSAPTGRITTVTPTSFTATWTHQTSLSTNAVEVRLKVSGSIVATSPTIAKTVANAGTITITWAESTFASLSWGTPYTVEIRGRDTNNVWSAWSPARSFFTNAAPAVPSQLTPADAAVTTSYPLLKAKASDPDNDAVTVKLRIKNNAGTVLQTRTATLVSGFYQYQVIAADFASYATYRWDAYSYDGHFYSGQTTTEANASRSPEQAIVYAQGPGTVITSPSDGGTITSRTFAVTWTATGQAKRQVLVYNAAGVLIHDSGDVSTTVQTYLVPNLAGYNNAGYTITVRVTDTNSLVGIASAYVTLAYPPATTIGAFAATPSEVGTDAEASVILLTWAATAYPASKWRGYRLYRTALDGIGGSAASPRELLRTITNPLQTSYLDAEGASRRAYLYEIEQVIEEGYDTLTSTPASAQVMLTFSGIVLASVFEPETYHVDLRFSSDRGNEGEWQFGQDVTFVRPAGSSKSRAIRGPRNEWSPSGKYKIVGDEGATAEQRIAAARDLIEHGGTLCYRDGHGEVRYVAVGGSPKVVNRRLHYELELQMQEVDFVRTVGVTS